MAWNEVCRLVGEPLRFAFDEPPDVALLNRQDFSRDQLDEPSYLAIADFVKNGVHDRIRQEFRRKFPGETPQLMPPRWLTLRPLDIVAYSYVRKDLQFPEPFERLDEPIVFGQSKVAGFGIGDKDKPGHAKLYPQVSILYYEDPDDFAVELKTKAPEDRVLLAKLRPETTLRQTVEKVLQRAAASQPSRALRGDVLKVPRLDFDITRQFEELEHRLLVFRNPQLPTDSVIRSALQSIRFQMNEKGVKLRSHARIVTSCSKADSPPPGRLMIFDKPFLILLQRTGAKSPYFALWVDNPELLVAAN
ncbi:MAG: hypothetical protein ACUVUC_03715 [Thermoguttaceae bacterium]